MDTDAPLAESSPAAEPALVTATEAAVVSGDVAAFREARLAERRGKPLDVAAESSPAEPAAQAISTEVTDPPASEPGTPRKKNADTRVQELLADRAAERQRAERAERELLTLKAPTQRPDASLPAPSAAALAFPTYDAYLTTQPDASYEEYLDARADARAEQRFTALRVAEAATQAQHERARAQGDRDEQFRQRIGAAVTADPAFMDSLSDAVKALKPFEAIRDAQGRWTEPPSAMHAIAEDVLASPVAPQLMRHFSDHPDDLERLSRLTPHDLLKAFGKLEARFETPTPVATPAPKTVTDAPPPPTILGTKPGAAASPIDAAVQSGDVSAFRAARLRERIATMR